jgi:hypothetical protein
MENITCRRKNLFQWRTDRGKPARRGKKGIEREK